MFWKFGFHNASAIDALLDREDVSLELILDEDDLLQECKSQNTRLIDYFQRTDVLHKLLGFVSGEIEGEERGRFKYPYVATEVLCSEIWSIVETCVNQSQQLLEPFWDSVLNTSPEDMRSKISLASHFVKINAVFLSKKPEEMLSFIRSLPNVIERLLAHIETPPFVDLMFRILQLDEQPGNMGVVQWLSSEKLIPRLVSLLSPAQKPDIHLVAADFLKGIIALSSPSPSTFPVNPNTMSILSGESLSALPTSNRLARELVHKENIVKLVGFMLEDMAEATKPATNSTPSASSDPVVDPHDQEPTSKDRAVSSLVNIIPVFIELIRKNNSDFFEPYLFHTLRNRLIQVRQQQQYDNQDISEEEVRDDLEKTMQEIVDHVGLVHLGGLLEVISGRLPDFQELLRQPRSSITPVSTTTGCVIPLTFERFRICELYAEILHCSNMALLNRPLGSGPQYDADGRLLGGLTGLEELARVVSNNPSGGESPQHSEDEDPGYAVSESRDFPVRSQNSTDASSMGSSDEGSTDGVNSDDVEDVLEEVHFDDEDDVTKKRNGSGPSHSPKSARTATSSDPSVPLSTLSLEDRPDVPVSPSMPSPGSDKTVMKTGKGSSPPTQHLGPAPGDVVKQKFLDLGVVSGLLDLFFEFPLNNFLHNVVYDLLHQILTGRVDKGLNRELIVSLFRDAQILQRIIEGQHQNDEACSKPKGYRSGFMGHLTLISEDIVSAFDHYPPDLIDILSAYAPRPEWDQYVTGKYKETKDKDTIQLGGGKPVLGLGLANFPNMALGMATGMARKVDEGDEFVARPGTTDATAPAEPSSSKTEVIEVEQGETSNSAFERYLAQQITPQERYSSSSSDNSSDEDDAGWLDAANRNFHFDEPGDFELANPGSPESHRRAGSEFHDSFEPSTMASGQDPFGADSDEDDSAWGPFSDSNVARDTTDSVSSSFTLSSTSDDDSFGDDFGEFQGSSVEVPAANDDDGGGRTPTPGGTFHFDSDFESTLFGSGSRERSAVQGEPSNSASHDTSSSASADRRPLPSQAL
ncbi:hypothetical protein FRB99_005884 [Tulasnella sp. 403]|nr:hypothetical protein FRB99_005884 [Tulasnella sp. 403]